MTDRAPRQRTLQVRVAALGAAVDGVEPATEAPFDGTVSRVAYIPDAAITGANTNTRTLSLINKAQDGTGSTSVASLALVSAVNPAANDETDLTLSATPANLVVASGDVLAWSSVHAASGLADPGGLVQIDVTGS